MKLKPIPNKRMVPPDKRERHEALRAYLGQCPQNENEQAANADLQQNQTTASDPTDKEAA